MNVLLFGISEEKDVCLELPHPIISNETNVLVFFYLKIWLVIFFF